MHRGKVAYIQQLNFYLDAHRNLLDRAGQSVWFLFSDFMESILKKT